MPATLTQGGSMDTRSVVPDTGEIQRVAFASAIGCVIEWYDFFLYGVVAGLVFNKLFFPNQDPFIGILLAYATFAVGFVARPVGGILFGHFGDRLGRKGMLVLTLLIMGIATFLIGFLPTYNDIGLWAPIFLLVLRVLQGLGIGGEWGGAVLMAVEYAPKERRGFYGSWPQIGVPAGLFLATIVVALLSMISEQAFLQWGWRVAFLLSALLVAVGLYVRLKILETRVFERPEETHGQAEVPLVILAIVVPFGIVYPMVYGPIAAMFSESFSTRVRYTGVSFVYQFSGIFASGLTPLIAATLLHVNDGQPWLIAGYIVVVSIISLISVALLGDRTGQDLADIDRMGAGTAAAAAAR